METPKLTKLSKVRQLLTIHLIPDLSQLIIKYLDEQRIIHCCLYRNDFEVFETRFDLIKDSVDDICLSNLIFKGETLSDNLPTDPKLHVYVDFLTSSLQDYYSLNLEHAYQLMEEKGYDPAMTYFLCLDWDELTSRVCQSIRQKLDAPGYHVTIIDRSIKYKKLCLLNASYKWLVEGGNHPYYVTKDQEILVCSILE